MTKYSIENKNIKVTIDTCGAELKSLISKQTNCEFIWQGDPAFWGRHAPVLFPIVGRLKDNSYQFDNIKYSLNQHGFARDLEFELFTKEDDMLDFVLHSNAETKELYPFDFELHLTYKIEGSELICGYRVLNRDDKTMYFSIGGHPAFNVPLNGVGEYTDYKLLLKPNDEYQRLSLTGPFVDLDKKQLTEQVEYNLSHELFSNDALIFETSGQQEIVLQSSIAPDMLKFKFDNFPFVGLWSPYPKEAPFVCIEPWCGLADVTNTTGKLEQKFGINELAANLEFTREYSIEIGISTDQIKGD